MGLKTNQSLVVLSLTLVTLAIYKYYFTKKKSLQTKEIHDVIMFSSDNSVLKKSKYSKCLVTESMSRLLYYMNSPRKTLDICIYIITNLDIAYALIKLHHRGVYIRVIIDADMAFSSGSQSRKLEKIGIPVRWMKSTNLMHHKFSVIDSLSTDPTVTPFVITGSQNWTNQALSGNWENVVVTSQRQIVEQYRQEFERLWVKFKPIVQNVS